MKQLYHTSCKKGYSVSGNSGFQVRAVTAGFPDGRIRAMLPFVGYDIPLAELDRSQLPESAPRRLALFEAPNAGRIIVHGVYVGQDPTTGRDGNYFSHLLCDVPDSVDAADVLQMWSSPAWQTQDDDNIAKQLEELESLPRDGTLNEQQLADFLSTPRHQEMFRFLLNAWLSLTEGGRIFLAANSAGVATCLWGLTRCLPSPLRSGLTFSTYEKNPLTSFARVVGAWWGNTQVRDLPHACYTGKNVGFNSFTDRPASALQKTYVYVDFLVTSCASGNIRAVDNFHENIKPDLLCDIEHLDWLYRLLHRPRSVTTDELRVATEVPTLRECVVAHPAAVVELTRAAVSDARYAMGVFSSLVTEISEDVHRREQVRAVAVETVSFAAEKGDMRTLDAFFDSFVPCLGSPLQAEVLNDTWKRLDRPTGLPTDSYAALLPRALRWLVGKREEDQVERWLTVSRDRLPIVLSADIDQTFKVRACLIVCGDRKDDITEISKLIRAHPELVIPVMKELVGTPTLGEACATVLFSSVINDSRSKPVGDQLLVKGGQLPLQVFECCLQQCLDCGCVTARDVAGSQWQSLPLSSEMHLSLCNALISECQVEELVSDGTLSGFLSQATTIRNAPSALRCRAKSLMSIRGFLGSSQMSQSAFRDIADALKVSFSQDDHRRLTELVAQRFSERLLASQGSDHAWAFLEAFLIAVGAVGGHRALYRLLLSQAAETPTFWNRPPMLHAYLACGFGVSAQGRSVPWNGELIEDAKEFAGMLAKRSGRRIFREVYRQSQSWREIGGSRQFQQWRIIARQIEPISILQRTSKAIVNVSGLVGRLVRRRDSREVREPRSNDFGGNPERQRPDRNPSRGHNGPNSDEPDIVYLDGSAGTTWRGRVNLFLNIVIAIMVLLIVWQLFFGDFPILRFLVRWLWSSIAVDH